METLVKDLKYLIFIKVCMISGLKIENFDI